MKLARVFRHPVTWMVLGVTGLLTGVALVRVRGPEVRTAQVQRKDIEQHITASGRVWVPTRVQVSAQIPGLILAVPVTEGQKVRTGDLLVQMDDAEARAAVAQAEASVNQARARVEQLRQVGAIVATEGFKKAQTDLERALADRARAEKLARAGAIPEADLANARRAVDVARAQASAAEAEQLSSAPQGADSRVALTALLRSQADLAAANVRLAQAQIRALQDAVVLTRHVEPGDVVQPSRTLLVLAAGTDTEQLVVQLDERNLSLLAVGQSALASADAYPQTRFRAVIDHIAPSVDASRGSIEVRFRALDPPPQLKPDMTVSVDVTVSAKAHALVVPSRALRAAASPQPWVFVVEERRVVRKDVTLGLVGEGATEVVDSLAEGAQVVLPDTTNLKEGMRVRPVLEE